MGTRTFALAAFTLALVACGDAKAVILFQDDFEDGNADGWTVGQGTWRVQNGRYSLISQPSPSVDYYTTAGAPSWSDYSFQALTRTSTNEPLGIIGRWSGPSGYYGWTSDTESRIEFRYGTSNWVTLARVAHAPVDRSQWHRLTLDFSGTSIRYYLDGALLIQVSDSRRSTGSIGLLTTKPADYDDVFAWRMPSGVPPWTPLKLVDALAQLVDLALSLSMKGTALPLTIDIELVKELTKLIPGFQERWSYFFGMLNGPVLVAYCPVDVEVTDPLGRVVSKTLQGIPGAQYYEGPLPSSAGDSADAVFFDAGSWVDGLYRFTVIPESGALANETYTLAFFDPKQGEARVFSYNAVIGSSPHDYAMQTGAVPEPGVMPLLVLAVINLMRQRKRPQTTDW